MKNIRIIKIFTFTSES